MARRSLPWGRRRVLRTASHLAFAFAVSAAAEDDAADTAEDVVDAVGRAPGEWTVEEWMNVDGRRGPSLADLRGKVVLVRWFTLTECPFCSASAPALNEFHELFEPRGLKVIGFYHHKRRSPLRMDEVRAAVEGYGFKFPVAVDSEWRTLRRWWLDGRERAWTSVSFLIDRNGIVRHVHPGGKYVKGDEAYRTLRRMIETLLEEEGEAGGVPPEKDGD